MKAARSLFVAFAVVALCAIGLLIGLRVGAVATAAGTITLPRGATVIGRLPTSVTVRPRPLPVVTVPVPPPQFKPPGFPSPAGEIYFISTRDGAAEVYQMHWSGAGQTRLTTAFGGVGDPTLSSDGKLAYSAAVNGHSEIVSGNPDKPPTQLTHDASVDREPRWLNDGTLVYVSNRGGANDIWKLDLATGSTVDLTPGQTGADLDPAPSPNGTRIAFSSSSGGSGFDIFVLTVRNRQVVQLTHDGAGNRHPSWSPDGGRIAYDRDGAGGSDIWTMAADGSNAKPLIATAADEFAPSYAPAPVFAADVRLAYVTNANGNYEIWVAKDDGSGAFDVSQSPGGDDLAPFWAPFPNIVSVRVSLQPQEVEGAGGGPNSPTHCTVFYQGKEPIVGTKYDDVICGSKHHDMILGRGGDDVIYPRGGKDTVFGGKGADLIYSRGGGEDTVHGGSNFDEAWVDQGDTPEPDVEEPLP